MTDQLLALLTAYGLPALFSLLLVAAAGLPIPVTLLLIAAGSFVAQGELTLWQVLLVSSLGAIAGDHLGYWMGRWGGRAFIRRYTLGIGGGAMLAKAEAFTRRWGGTGIFLSRWLVCPLGPWLNLTSGITAYSWQRFLMWDVLGELLWVGLYVSLGMIFSDRVQFLVDLAGSFTWVIVGVLATLVLGWRLAVYLRPAAPAV